MVFWFLIGSPSASEDPARREELPGLAIGTSWDRFITGRDRKPLEEALKSYLPRCRWYGGKAKSLKQLQIADTVRMAAEGKEVHLLMLDTRFEDGSQEQYLLPVTLLPEGAESENLKQNSPQACIAGVFGNGNKGEKPGLLVDAMADPGFCRALYQRLRKDKIRRSGTQVGLPASRLPWYDKSPREELRPRALSAEQSNTSIIFGDKFILKVFRKLGAGVNPDLEIGRYLTEKTPFAHSPKVAGWLDYRRGRQEPSTLAILQEFVPDSRDAWSYAREEVRRFFDRALASAGDIPGDTEGSILALQEHEIPATARSLVGVFLASAELLGRRTAELHLALSQKSDDPEFTLESYGTLYHRSVYQSMRNLALGSLRLVRQRQAALPAAIRKQTQELLSQERLIVDRLEEFRRTRISAMRMRHHGDYHLGQVLFTGKDFRIIDFAGEPARSLADRRRKRSALRDVAGMIRSLHYAAVSSLLDQTDSGIVREADLARLEGWSRHWYRWVSSSFLRAYLKTAEGAAFLPKDKNELRVLLNVFLLEKALYEVAYELNNRPDWLRIPLRGIADVLTEGGKE
jgi:maltose alpha-D-glucosyltransferase/alpha-amylase